jgi:hypothetical protein
MSQMNRTIRRTAVYLALVTFSFALLSYSRNHEIIWPTSAVTSAQCSLLTESWIARRNNTQWIPTFRS